MRPTRYRLSSQSSNLALARCRARRQRQLHSARITSKHVPSNDASYLLVSAVDRRAVTLAQPLSVRMGKRSPTGPYDGVPDHLVHPLLNWVRIFFYGPYGQVGNSQFLQYLSLHLRLVVPPAAGEAELLNQLLNRCVQDSDFLLDLLDSMLGRCPIDTQMRLELAALLSIGDSVWTVAADQNSLVTRVDDTAVQQFKNVTAPADSASAELKEAWA